MKVIFLTTLMAFAFFMGTAFAQTSPLSNEENKMSLYNPKILVVYYSRTGNTKEIANQIHSIAGGDIFEIQTVNDYPEDYSETTKQAKREITEDYKPALKNKIANIEDYNIIFVGSPCWWSTIAPPVRTFLSEYDFSDKTIVPFMTHGGSGLGRSVSEIRKLLPDSMVLNGRSFRSNDVKNATDEITNWVKGL